MKVLLCANVSPELLDQVKAVSAGLDVVMASGEDALREARVAEVIFGHCDKEVLAAAKHLKWFQSSSAGLDKFPLSHLPNPEVILCNASGLHATQVAEHAWALTLALSRGIPGYLRDKEKRLWRGQGFFDLSGGLAGILGFGGIGREYAKRARAFDMRIVAVDAHVTEKPDFVECLLGPERLDDLVRMADVLFIAIPYTERTTHLIDAGRLALMKPTAFLINTARGAIVDERALIAALKEHRIAGAGLDVFEVEPLPVGSELWGLDNVIITPHYAGASAFRPKRLIDFFCENLRRYLDGHPLMNVVDKTLGYPVRC